MLYALQSQIYNQRFDMAIIQNNMLWYKYIYAFMHLYYWKYVIYNIKIWLYNLYPNITWLYVLLTISIYMIYLCID